MNTGYIAKYNGTPIYGVSSKQYIEMRGKNEHDPNVIYAILDKENYFIQGNYVIGQAVDRFRKLRTVSNGKEWRKFLGIEENIQRNPYETEKARSKVVITERPTVESLSNEGARKLEEVSKATAQAVGKLNGSGEAALAQVAKAGEAALDMMAKETEEVVKKTTTRRSSTTRKKRTVK